MKASRMTGVDIATECTAHSTFELSPTLTRGDRPNANALLQFPNTFEVHMASIFNPYFPFPTHLRQCGLCFQINLSASSTTSYERECCSLYRPKFISWTISIFLFRFYLDYV